MLQITFNLTQEILKEGNTLIEMKERLALSLKGMAMGMAEVVPGVSGGTIAFITGIYEELLYTIKSVDIEFFKLFFSFKWKAAFAKVNGVFLMFLVVGMLLGIVLSLFVVTYLLENHSEGLWAFFFGLIIASSIYIGNKVSDWNIKTILLLIVGALISYAITIVTPAGGTESLPFVFFSGAIAISALILPGISGSFILLLLGMYGVIIPHVKSLISSPNSHSLLIVFVFGLGCILGLALFSRILSYAFKQYKDATLAILTGFMIGSLNKIWPWRNPTRWLDKETYKTIDSASASFIDYADKEIKILNEANVLPGSYDGDANVTLVIISGVLGLVVIYLLSKLEKKES